MFHILNKLKQNIINLVFPLSCIACEDVNEVLCDSCLSKCAMRDSMACAFCGRESFMNKTCETCKDSFDIDYVFSLYEHDQPYIKELLRLAKYKNVSDAGKRLGEIVGNQLQRIHLTEVYTLSNPLIIAVPLHKRKLLERGYNQSTLIAHEVSNLLHIELGDVAQRIKNTQTQTALTPQERMHNVADAFVVTTNLQGRDIILIDDVFTTGSTLQGVASALKKAGANKIIAITIAKGGN